MAENGKSTGSRLMLVLAGVGVVAFLVALRYFHVPDLLRRSLDWVAGLGPTGVIAFVVIYILACVFMLPGSVLTLGAGAVFGVVKGSAICSVAATLGATAAFLVGRYLARDRVARMIEGNERFRAIDEAVGREGWKIVGLTRLSPVFPFNLLNYAYGITRVSLRDYFLASWIGMLPGDGDVRLPRIACGQPRRPWRPRAWPHPRAVGALRGWPAGDRCRHGLRDADRPGGAGEERSER